MYGERGEEIHAESSYHGMDSSDGGVLGAARAKVVDDPTGAGKNKKGSYDLFHTFLIFVFPALGGLLFGYDIGSTSVVLTQLEDEDASGTKWYDTVADSPILRGLITSTGVIGAMVGSIIIFTIADDIGRKRTLLCAGILYIAGALIEAFSGAPSFNTVAGISLLLLGRALYGLGCGFAMHGAPAYIGEMAPPSIRGLLVSLKEAFIVLGMTLGYIFGYIFQETPGGWRYTYGLASIFAFIFFVGIWFLPYSSRWLALRGRMEEAKESMRFVSPNITEEEVEEVLQAAEEAARLQKMDDGVDDDGLAGGSGSEEAPTPTCTRWHNAFQREYRRFQAPAVKAALIAGVGVIVFQQITGQPSVLYYANSIFDSIGLSGAASIGVSVFKLAMTLGTTVTVDRYGRKLLLYIGCVSMLVALVLLSVLFAFPTTTATQYSILAALFVYIGGYQIGFGPIAWLFISEIFPLEVRGKAVSIAVVTNFFWNAVMSLVFPVEIDAIGASATFMIYGAILVVAIYFIHRKVPETKGLSLEEITRKFLGQAKADKALEEAGGDEGPNSPLLGIDDNNSAHSDPREINI